MSENKTLLKISESNANHCVSNESTVSFKVPNKLAVYLPENLDLDKIIAENPINEFLPFQGESVYFQKEKLMYILHLITYLPSMKKDFDYEGNAGFVPLCKKRLQDSAIHDYRPHLDYLVHCGIILEDPQYIVGEKSKGIKFIPEYDFVKIRRLYIYKKPIIKAVMGKSFQNQIEHMDKYHYLYKWWNTQKLHIAYDEAKQYLEKNKEKELALFETKYGMNDKNYFNYRLSLPKRAREGKIKYPTKQYNSAIMVVDRLQKYEYLAKIDETAGRFHTLLTQLPTELRQFVTYDGKGLVGVDLVNSQPLLATALLDKVLFESNPILFHYIAECNPNHNDLSLLARFIGINQKKADVLKYREIASKGEYYEEFGSILQSKGLIPSDVADEDVRDFAKKATFSSFFAPNSNAKVSEPMQHFKASFPNVYATFSKIKYTPKGTKRIEKLHNALSVCLQAFEAELFLNRICRRINEVNPEIVIFTIHDSIVTTTEYVEVVKQTVAEEIYKAIKVNPKFNIEYWKSKREE